MGKRSRKHQGKGNSTFHNAPMQGMDGVMNQKFNDYTAIFAPQGTTGTVTVRCGFDVNGFSWTVTQGSNLISESPVTLNNQEFYADDNKLFSYWANLFAQYRMNSIEATVEPVASGGVVSVTPVINVIDEDNVLGVRAQSYQSLLPNLGFMRTGKLCSPQSPVHRKLNYNKWLGQTTAEAWRQTQDPDPPTGVLPGAVRQVYPTQKNNASSSEFVTYPVKNLPAVVFVFAVNIAANTSGVILAVVHVASHFSFRLRNLIPAALQPTPPVVQRESNETSSTAEDLSESTRSRLAHVLKALQ